MICSLSFSLLFCTMYLFCSSSWILHETTFSLSSSLSLIVLIILFFFSVIIDRSDLFLADSVRFFFSLWKFETQKQTIEQGSRLWVCAVFYTRTFSDMSAESVQFLFAQWKMQIPTARFVTSQIMCKLNIWLILVQYSTNTSVMWTLKPPVLHYTYLSWILNPDESNIQVTHYLWFHESCCEECRFFDEQTHFQQTNLEKTTSVKLCTYVILLSEAQTSNCMNKKKKYFLT